MELLAANSAGLQRREQSQQGGRVATIDPMQMVASPTVARGRRRATLMH